MPEQFHITKSNTFPIQTSKPEENSVTVNTLATPSRAQTLNERDCKDRLFNGKRADFQNLQPVYAQTPKVKNWDHILQLSEGYTTNHHEQPFAKLVIDGIHHTTQQKHMTVLQKMQHLSHSICQSYINDLNTHIPYEALPFLSELHDSIVSQHNTQSVQREMYNYIPLIVGFGSTLEAISAHLQKDSRLMKGFVELDNTSVIHILNNITHSTMQSWQHKINYLDVRNEWTLFDAVLARFSTSKNAAQFTTLLQQGFKKITDNAVYSQSENNKIIQGHTLGVILCLRNSTLVDGNIEHILEFDCSNTDFIKKSLNTMGLSILNSCHIDWQKSKLPQHEKTFNQTISESPSLQAHFFYTSFILQIEQQHPSQTFSNTAQQNLRTLLHSQVQTLPDFINLCTILKNELNIPTQNLEIVSNALLSVNSNFKENDALQLLQASIKNQNLTPIGLFKLISKPETSAKIDVFLNKHQTRFDAVEWNTFHNMNTSITGLIGQRNVLNSIQSPLLHQSLFFLQRGYSIDIHASKETQLKLVQQLLEQHPRSLCIDTLESMSWLEDQSHHIKLLDSILQQGGTLLIDEAHFAAQTLEQLNEIKEGNRLHGQNLPKPVQIVSFTNKEQTRSKALSSRSIQIYENQFPAGNLQNIGFNLNTAHVNQVQSGAEVDCSNSESIYKWIDNPTPTVVLQKIPLTPGISLQHLALMTHKLNTATFLEKTTNTHIQTKEFKSPRFIHQGPIVDSDTFDQTLLWDIKIENNIFSKKPGLIYKNTIPFIYTLEKLSSPQLTQIQGKVLNIIELPEKQVINLDQLPPIQGQKSIQPISLEYTAEKITPRNFSNFLHKDESPYWITSEDQASHWTCGIKKNNQAVEYNPGVLLKAIQNNEKIVVFGLEDHPELARQVIPLFFPQPYLSIFGQHFNCSQTQGRIRFVVTKQLPYIPPGHYAGLHMELNKKTTKKNPELWPGFSLLKPSHQRQWIPAEHSWEQKYNLPHLNTDRDQVIHKVIKDYCSNRCILLLGDASSGKSTLLHKLTRQDTAFCTSAGQWGTDSFNKTLTQWATHKDSNYSTLIIDEATLQKDWTLLNSFFLEKPYIRIENKIIPLTPQHKIALAGNYPNMIGRHYIPLLAEHAAVTQIPSLSSLELLQGVINPILNSVQGINTDLRHQLRLFLSDIHNIAINKIDTEFTPRQLKQLTLYTASLLCRKEPLSTETIIHRLTSYIQAIYSNNVENEDSFFSDTENDIMQHLRSILPQDGHAISPIDFNAWDLATTSSVEIVNNFLKEHLELREQLVSGLSDNSKSPAMHAIMIEGEPGSGKDATVQAIFNNRSDFIHLNAGHNLEEITTQVNLAAKEGYVIAISEFNAIPSSIWEGILNDILTGQMPNGEPIHPGFLFIGTMNSNNLSGRETLSSALKSRSLSLYLPKPRYKDLDILLQHSLSLNDLFKDKEDLNVLQYDSLRNLDTAVNNFMTSNHYFENTSYDTTSEITTPPRTLLKLINEYTQGVDKNKLNQWFQLHASNQSSYYGDSLSDYFDMETDSNMQVENISILQNKDNELRISTIIGKLPAKELIKSTEKLSLNFTYNPIINKFNFIEEYNNTATHNSPLEITNHLKVSASTLEDLEPKKIGTITYNPANRRINPIERLTVTLHNFHGEIVKLQKSSTEKIPTEKTFTDTESSYTFKIQTSFLNGTLRNNHREFVLPMPDSYSIAETKLALYDNSNTQRGFIQGAILPDEISGVYLAAFSTKNLHFLETISNIIDDPLNLTLEYTAYKTYSTDDSIDTPSVKTDYYSQEQKKDLFQNLPEEIQNLISKLQTSEYPNNITHLRDAIHWFSKNYFYPLKSSETLESLYQFNTENHIKYQEHIANTMLTEKIGRCSHAAFTWSWLLNTFTAHECCTASGLSVQNNDLFDSTHAWIKVKIGQEWFEFDPTPSQLLHESVEIKQEDMDIFQQILQNEKIQHENSAQENSTHINSKDIINSSTKRKAESIEDQTEQNMPVRKKSTSPSIQESVKISDILNHSHHLILNNNDSKRFQGLSALIEFERSTLGKSYTLSDQGTAINVNKIGTGTDKIFKKPYLAITQQYKNLVFSGFYSRQPMQRIFEAVFLQHLLDIGVPIYAPNFESKRIEAIASAQDLFHAKDINAARVPQELKGNQSIVFENNAQEYNDILTSAFKHYSKSFNSNQAAIIHLFSNNYRTWMWEHKDLLEPKTLLESAITKSRMNTLMNHDVLFQKDKMIIRVSEVINAHAIF